jgi:hypothetical protein
MIELLDENLKIDKILCECVGKFKQNFSIYTNENLIFQLLHSSSNRLKAISFFFPGKLEQSNTYEDCKLLQRWVETGGLRKSEHLHSRIFGRARNWEAVLHFFSGYNFHF